MTGVYLLTCTHVSPTIFFIMRQTSAPGLSPAKSVIELKLAIFKVRFRTILDRLFSFSLYSLSEYAEGDAGSRAIETGRGENKMYKQNLQYWIRTVRERIEEVWTDYLLRLRDDMVKDERAKDEN